MYKVPRVHTLGNKTLNSQLSLLPSRADDWSLAGSCGGRGAGGPIPTKKEAPIVVRVREQEYKHKA